MDHLAKLVIVALAGLLALTLMGCAASAPVGAGQAQSKDLVWPADAAAYLHAEWQPNTGRMREAVWRRHRQPELSEAILWADRFCSNDGQSPLGWKTVGSPELHPTNVYGRLGMQVLAGANNRANCGLQRELNPTQLRGRDVRLDLTFACPSVSRREALRGVRISLAAADTTGAISELFLPFTGDLAPGWETLHWWMRFGHEIGPATLRLHLLNAGASITVEEIRMIAVDQPVELVETPVAGKNLIVGGSFETQRHSFFASLLRRWPDGQETLAPLPYEYDHEAAVGDKSLHFQVAATCTGRVGFGPLRMAMVQRSEGIEKWHLRFYSRATKPTTLTASLRSHDRTLARLEIPLGPQWEAFKGVFDVESFTTDRSVLCNAELVFDTPNRDAEGNLDVWLDGVSLTDEPITDYQQAEVIEVGITGPVPLTVDLANIVAEENESTFQINLLGNPAARAKGAGDQGAGATSTSSSPALDEPVGELALDLLDGWDRSVWSRTSKPIMDRDGMYTEKVSLSLPRGYYRLLATLWSGHPGRSRLISRDECAVAVISFRDPVPMGNRFGLSTSGGCVSGYTTALGAGWVRMDLAAQRVETKSGTWDFAQWQAQLMAAKQANAEVVAGLTLPTDVRFHRVFVEQWLAGNPLQPIGLVVNPPAISTRPAEEYIEELSWVSQVLATASPHTRLVCDLSALDLRTRERPTFELPQGPSFAIGYASTEGGLPENSESLLESIGKRYMGDLNVWDLGVPVRLGGVNSVWDWRLQPVSRGSKAMPVSRLEAPLDPLLTASRMVRSILIRALAGVQLVCCEATMLSAPGSAFDDSHQWLHEHDLTPRPALVAFERMTSLLNDATLARWIDLAGGVHVLFYEKDDGGAVAVLWRPFGLSPTRLSFSQLPTGISVLDCLGMPVPPVAMGDSPIIEVNEMVRYVVAPAGQGKALSDLLDAVRVQSGLPQSRPSAD